MSSIHVVGDPRALYDPANNRFVVVAEDFTNNTFVIAATTSGNPTSTWRIYSFSASLGGVGCGDYPMLGQTMNEINDAKGALYLSWDRFGCSGGPFLDDEIWIIPKTAIYGGTAPLIWVWFNLTAGGVKVDHVQPANVVSRADRPVAEFLVNTFNFNSGCFGGCNGLVIWASYDGATVTGTNIGEPSLSARVISTPHNYIQPVTAAQPGAPTGNGCAINTGTVGITGTVNYSAGRLYAAATTRALNGQLTDGIEYWEIQPYLNQNDPPTFSGIQAPTIQNEICWGCFGFSGDNTFSAYYPTAQPDDEGNVTAVFNFSGQYSYPSVGYISKRSTMRPGSFSDSGIILKSGAAFYCQIDSFSRNRNGTATSPYGTAVAKFPKFWFAGSYAEPNAQWGTAIGQNGYKSPILP